MERIPFSRLLRLEPDQHILLLGARGTGKTSYLRTLFPSGQSLWIDLLLPKSEDQFSRDPERLISIVGSLQPGIKTVVIDEIQKVPALLDVIHSLIESSNLQFVLTGSSARKLRAGSANLLAGRALAYSFFPLTSFELGRDFELAKALMFGTLPKIWNLKTDGARRKTLETYALTYLNEEIRAEQAVRALDPFRKFLEVAAQTNGKIINFHSIARDVGVDEKTVRSYYQILEDTLIGFFLEAYDGSLRRRVGKAPKFFFFDTGVTRALTKNLTVRLLPSTYAWGDAFEHFVITEIYRLISYSGNQFSLHYLRTYDDVEIDLVISRPGRPILLLEIKSTFEIKPGHLKHLLSISKEFEDDCQLACLSSDPTAQLIDGVECLPWQDGLRKFFSGPDLESF
jgi:predicted AAA+ superfamily ATPase